MKGKTLNLVLDDPNYDTTMREQTNDATQLQLSKALGARLNFAWAAEGADIGYRPGRMDRPPAGGTAIASSASLSSRLPMPIFSNGLGSIPRPTRSPISTVRLRCCLSRRSGSCGNVAARTTFTPIWKMT
jgi:hypothetical protein